MLRGVVIHVVAIEIDSKNKRSRHGIASAELAAGYWLMCQVSGRGNMGSSKFQY